MQLCRDMAYISGNERVTKDSPKLKPLSRMKFVNGFEPAWTCSMLL
jgi:hypothetical protein